MIIKIIIINESKWLHSSLNNLQEGQIHLASALQTQKMSICKTHKNLTTSFQHNIHYTELCNETEQAKNIVTAAQFYHGLMRDKLMDYIQFESKCHFIKHSKPTTRFLWGRKLLKILSTFYNQLKSNKSLCYISFYVLYTYPRATPQ